MTNPASVQVGINLILDLRRHILAISVRNAINWQRICRTKNYENKQSICIWRIFIREPPIPDSQACTDRAESDGIGLK